MVGAGPRTERALDSPDPGGEITDLDELGSRGHDRGHESVPCDRVLEPERIDSDRFEERLVVLDAAQAGEAVDGRHRALLASVQPAEPARFGKLVGRVG